MPVADPSFGGQEALAASSIISTVAFLVTWVATDLGHVSRTPYVAILTLTTLALAAGYIAWSGTSVVELLAGWGWGILGGSAAAAVIVALVRRLAPRALGSLYGSSGRESCTGPRKRSCSRPCRSSLSGRLPMRSAGRTPPGRGLLPER